MDKFLNQNGIRILDSLPEGVYVIDKEFKVKFVNKAALQITNIELGTVLDEVCRSFCKSDRCEIGCPITEVLRTNKNVTDLESTIQHKDGTLIPIVLNASILEDDLQNPIGGIISFKLNRRADLNKHFNDTDYFHGIVGKSKSMNNIFKTINEISHSFASVLITGETGVGKELVANAIQRTSQRSSSTYVKINCSVLPGELLTSELFGHIKGSFTDATYDRIGRFEFADGGTVFLDEITETPIDVQAHLLRVLQDGSFERLGESKTRKTDVRIIAATNKKLSHEIEAKRFREDLFYRLNVIPIFVPPLRDRKEDIVHLVSFFLKKFAEKYNKPINRIDDESMELFLNYNWPGNVRELENCIEYAFIRSKREDYICACCLPPILRTNKNCSEKLNVKEKELDEKAQTLLALLRQNNWNKSKVASILGVDRSTIHRRLKNIDET